LVALRETPEQALSAGWKDDVPVDLIAAVAVPVVEEIPYPRNVRRLELKIGGIPNSSVPEDSRQTFAGGRLVIEREGDGDVGTFTLPYDGDSLTSELSTTPFLQADHPRVRAAASDAVGGDADARRVAEAIRKWVYRRLDKVPTASIPNALQVLEMGAGDCNEHAVLYAAMCRAVGLPARVVAGAVYSEGVFLYHAWNEVWLGTSWVTVDATFDQMPVDATHIKLLEGGPEVHADMLGVIGRLSIEVLSVH
jgi:transglutaminase-like putative cysteine protease